MASIPEGLEFQAAHAPTGWEIVPEDKSFWEKKVDEFKLKAQEFYTALQVLLSLENDPAITSDSKLITEWKELVNRGYKIRDVVQYVTAKIDAAVNWFKSTFSGYDDLEAQELYTQQFGAFPLLALVPIAAIAAAAALMVKFVSDVYIFNKKIAEIHKLIDQGIAPEKAAALVKATEPAPLLGNLSTIVKWGAIGFAAWIIYNEFIRKGKF